MRLTRYVMCGVLRARPDRGGRQFSGDGSTPTGLSTLDLNSPEPDPVSYGPYPINRFVQGLKGMPVKSVPVWRRADSLCRQCGLPD
jgi:hypothetical protein